MWRSNFQTDNPLLSLTLLDFSFRGLMLAEFPLTALRSRLFASHSTVLGIDAAFTQAEELAHLLETLFCFYLYITLTVREHQRLLHLLRFYETNINCAVE